MLNRVKKTTVNKVNSLVASAKEAVTGFFSPVATPAYAYA